MFRVLRVGILEQLVPNDIVITILYPYPSNTLNIMSSFV